MSPRTTCAVATLLLALLAACAAAPPRPAAKGSLIADIATGRARHSPGEPVAITVTLRNADATPFTGAVAVAFSHLGDPVGSPQLQPVEPLAPGAERSLSFTWAPPPDDFRGYLLEVSATDRGGAERDRATSAVDVSSDWRRFPRYGFVSRYGEDVDAAAVMAELSRYHLNAIQFYDWQWQHHRPLSPEPRWPDIAGRPISRRSVEALIAAAHERGMLAMHYNLAFGAYAEYPADGSGVRPEWGLFTRPDNGADPQHQDRHPLPPGWATEGIALFDPGNPGWQAYIIERQRELFAALPFDGWHIDTLGNRGARYDAAGNRLAIADSYAGFVNNARAALGRRMVFNSVGGYGQDQIAAGAAVDILYTELWEQDGAETYRDIRATVARARALSDKAIVLPAYMHRDMANALPEGATAPFNPPGVLLAEAAIFASGATRLELGDGGAMLSTEYFPSQKLVMSDSLRTAIRGYYDFLVAYENLLLDGVEHRTAAVDLGATPVSTSGRPGAVWAMVNAAPGHTVLHLINLSANTIALWRDPYANYPAPPILTDVPVKLYLPAAPPAGAVLRLASPDHDGGAARDLAYTTGSDAAGAYISFTLPRLEYWDMLWLDAAS